VVRDEPAVRMFHVPAGARYAAARGLDGSLLELPEEGWTLSLDAVTPERVLSFAWPGVSHAVLLRFDPADRFLGWYVNLQSPLEPTPLGFDYVDHLLDVLVDPDRTWHLHDEELLEEAVRRGLLPPAEAEAARAEAARVIRAVEAGEPPFDGSWTRWRPDPAWPVPTLPPGWDA
jgi:predicted RNA-binding protein associated with RNAse of E/G family